MLHHGFFFWNFKNFKVRAQASTFFSLRFFLYYIDIHIVHEKEKCTHLRSYIPRAVNVVAELMGMWVNLGAPTMSFILNTINVEYLCDASYVTWKYRQYRKYQGCKCRGGVKCLWECEWMRGALPWVLLYIPLLWNVCAMQVM